MISKKDFFALLQKPVRTEEVNNSAYLCVLAADMAGGDSEDWQRTVSSYRKDCEKENMIQELMFFTEIELKNMFSKTSKILSEMDSSESTEFEDLLIFALRQVAGEKKIVLP